ncbi:MAG: glycosyltransferase family 4 protein [Alphaproteobacteria bacterium]|nr:glycosyltransferase family 4 protein [Alphaproteobacteria bacterium]
MRVAFYSPMAEPDARVASGVQRMGKLLQSALTAAGAKIVQPTLPRTYEGRGDGARQIALRADSKQAAAALLQHVRKGTEARPDLWFSYHVYYKSPDWIGPAVSRVLSIPYLIAEGSHAPKRAGGLWALGHEGATAALGAADRLLAMTVFDRFCLDQLAPGRVRDLKPFIDVAPFIAPRSSWERVRFVTVGTMKDERKRASYALLADALRRLDVPYSLTVAGDGPYRAEIEAMFAGLDVRFAGMVPAEQIPAFLAAGDIFAWPGLGEAYGLVFLEAQAAGLGVVACDDRGVPDAVGAGSALLSAPGDVAAYAANLRRVAIDGQLRQRLGEAARGFVAQERSVEAAARTLRAVIAEVFG